MYGPKICSTAKMSIFVTGKFVSRLFSARLMKCLCLVEKSPLCNNLHCVFPVSYGQVGQIASTCGHDIKSSPFLFLQPYLSAHVTFWTMTRIGYHLHSQVQELLLMQQPIYVHNLPLMAEWVGILSLILHTTIITGFTFWHHGWIRCGESGFSRRENPHSNSVTDYLDQTAADLLPS